MPYSSFNLTAVRDQFNLTLREGDRLFTEVAPINPSSNLKALLEDYIPLATAISTEKARSEFLVAPILAETRRQLNNQISLFSGSEFTVDPEQGLQGFCDYILCGSPEQLIITQPVVTIVEAKRENLIGGLGQCIAAMRAAQQYNQQSSQKSSKFQTEIIYGVVTSGTSWKFLQLQGHTVSIDSAEYYINQIDQILGILIQPFQPLVSAA